MAFSATVSDVRLESRGDGHAWWQISLDRTEFTIVHARGTLTAHSPNGVPLVVTVERVISDGQTVWHVTRKPLPIGTKVRAEVIRGDDALGEA